MTRPRRLAHVGTAPASPRVLQTGCSGRTTRRRVLTMSRSASAHCLALRPKRASIWHDVHPKQTDTGFSHIGARALARSHRRTAGPNAQQDRAFSALARSSFSLSFCPSHSQQLNPAHRQVGLMQHFPRLRAHASQGTTLHRSAPLPPHDATSTSTPTAAAPSPQSIGPHETRVDR